MTWLFLAGATLANNGQQEQLDVAQLCINGSTFLIVSILPHSSSTRLIRPMSTLEEYDPTDVGDLPFEVRKNLPTHLRFMTEALHMAEKALAAGEVPVGCVIVFRGEIVGSGMNDTNKSLNGTRHAEFLAITELLSSYPPNILESADLYVTVEPCIMCACALRQYRVSHRLLWLWERKIWGNRHCPIDTL